MYNDNRLQDWYYQPCSDRLSSNSSRECRYCNNSEFEFPSWINTPLFDAQAIVSRSPSMVIFATLNKKHCLWNWSTFLDTYYVKLFDSFFQITCLHVNLSFSDHMPFVCSRLRDWVFHVAMEVCLIVCLFINLLVPSLISCYFCYYAPISHTPSLGAKRGDLATRLKKDIIIITIIFFFSPFFPIFLTSLLFVQYSCYILDQTCQYFHLFITFH